MSGRVVLLLLPFLLMPWHGQAAQPSPQVELSAEERAWIKLHPLVRVANEDDWPPYDFSDKGFPSGYSIDLVKLVAKKVGLELEFINGYSIKCSKLFWPFY